MRDPKDTYFARVLASAPDQLLSNNRPELLVAREGPQLPIDPEMIRVVIDGATNDLAGLTAMQPMEKATDSDVHYLLPLPGFTRTPTSRSAFSPTNFASAITSIPAKPTRRSEWFGRRRKAASAARFAPPAFSIQRPR